MTLDRVTSLADLAFKAKTNKYYEQLVLIAYRYLISGNKVGYIEALESLNNMAVNYNPNSCSSTVEQINELRVRVKEEVPKPAPVVEAAAPAVPPAGGFSPAVDEASEKLKKIVVEALKKKSPAKKKNASASGSTRNLPSPRPSQRLGSPRRRSTVTAPISRRVRVRP